LKWAIVCRANLANRHINVSPHCPVCKSWAEDIKHLLFEYSLASEVGNPLGLGDIIHKSAVSGLSWEDTLEYLLNFPGQEATILGQALQQIMAIASWYV
jgi:hypothetical protein